MSCTSYLDSKRWSNSPLTQNIATQNFLCYFYNCMQMYKLLVYIGCFQCSQNCVPLLSYVNSQYKIIYDVIL